MSSGIDMSTKNHDQIAKFRDIWDQYQRGIKALLRSKVSNEADAEDILQEILIRTYDKLHTVKSEETIKSWLFQISRNAIIDYYRKSGRNRERRELPPGLPYEEHNEDVQHALAECVMPFIGSLPPDAREALTAIDIDGKSQKEYAEELGIKYSTLKSRVQRSRAQLREVFESCCQLSRDSRGNITDVSSKTRSCDC